MSGPTPFGLRCEARGWTSAMRLLLVAVMLGPCAPPALAWYDEPAPTAGRIAIEIDHVADDLGEAWPMYCGVPFPDGSLSDASHARLVDASGEPVPAQMRVMARWPESDDIRWLGVHFQGDPEGEFYVEFGEEPLAADLPADRPMLERTDAGYEIDTGPAKFIVPERGPLIARAYHAPDATGEFTEAHRVIANEAGDDLYVIDNEGREATIGRDDDTEQVRVETVPGDEIGAPLNTVIRREGWYVTDADERIARHITRLHFTAGKPFVRIEHTLVLTEDTDELWFRDVGLRLRHELGDAGSATFAASHDGDADEALVTEPIRSEDDVLYMFQERAPYFSDTAARAVIGHASEEEADGTVLHEREKLGDWAAIDDNRAGLAVAIRQLWQQFPKEISVDRDAVTAHLWSSRGGWELDLRYETRKERIPDDWLNREYYGSHYDNLERLAGSGLGMARTHELMLHLHGPDTSGDELARVMRGFSEPVLCLVDPEWFYRSDAMGPIHPRDPERFPGAEGFIEAYFDQTMEVVEQWGDYGFLDFGARPHVWYRQKRDGPLEGQWTPNLNRYGPGLDYGTHAHVWRLYARSGQRKYYDFAEQANRHRMDLGMVHWDGPREAEARETGEIRDSGVLYNKFRGGYAIGSGSSPFHWGRFTQMHHASGTDIQTFFYYYYLRDFRRARDVADDYHQLVLDLWRSGTHNPFTATRPFASFKNIATLYKETGDEELLEIGRERAEDLIDLDTPQGVTDRLATGVGKYGVKIDAVHRWHWATGDEVAADALERGATTHATTFMGRAALGYFNASASYLSAAYHLTGDPMFARTLRRDIDVAISSHYDDRADEWDVPMGAAANNVYPMGGVPLALDALARHGETVDRIPIVQQMGHGRQTLAIFRKPADEPVVLDVRAVNPITPRVLAADGSALENVEIEMHEDHLYRRDPYPTSARLTVPAEADAGEYVVDPGVGGGVWEVTWTDAAKLVKYAPGGLVTGNRASGRFIRPGGTIVAAAQWWHFDVPGDAFEFYASDPVELIAPDGERIETEALQWQRIEASVAHGSGLWKLRAPKAAFVSLRGLPPVLAGQRPDYHFTPDLDRLAAAIEAAAVDPPPSPASASPRHRLVGETLDVERGERVGEQQFEHFDMREGTLELWFKPEWTSVYEPRTSVARRRLLDAGAWDIWLHRFGELSTTFLVGGEGGTMTAIAALSFEADQWTHMAYQWHRDEDDAFVVEIYVDGRLQNMHRTAGGEHSVEEDFVPQDIAETLVFGARGGGSLDAEITQLRISDERRYEESFTPAELIERDEKTLFMLDGHEP